MNRHLEPMALQAVTQYPYLAGETGLEATDFADPIRRRFYAALLETRAFTATGSASPLEVARRAGIDNPAAWVASESWQSFAVVEQAREVAKTLRALSLGEAFAMAARAALSNGRRGLELVAHVGELARQFEERGNGSADVTDLETVTLRYLDEQERRLKSGAPAGHSTGIPTLDRATKGFRAGELTTLVAAAGAGKSTLADFWRRLLARQEVYSIMFAGEMTEEQLGERMAHAESLSPLTVDLDLRDIQAARQRIQLSGALRYLLLDSRPRIEPSRVRAVVQSRKVKHGSIGLMVIDHLRHLEVEGARRFGDIEQIVRAAQEAKALAKELQIPTLLLCHVNREGERVLGQNGEPEPSIIRGGPTIYNESDNMLCLWRPEHLSTLYIWKARQTGFKGKIPLHFDYHTQSFREES